MPTDLVPALDGLAPVSLAELDQRAALQTRVDRKYVVPAADVPLLLAGLTGRVLEIGGRRSFGYASTYVDTPDLASYRGAAHRRRRRFKVRTRWYVDTGGAWVEVKTRGARGSTVKQRVAREGDRLGLDRLGAVELAFVGAALREGGVTDVDPASLATVLDTAFERSTLLLPAGATGRPTRATLDTGLRWATPRGARVEAGPIVVVETKAAPGVAGEVDRRLWALGHRPTRVSKFCIGLALLTPGLPANRWHRAVPRHATTLVGGG